MPRYLQWRYLKSFVRNPRWWLSHWHERLRTKQLRIFGFVLWRGDLWLPPCPPCPHCGHMHRLGGCARCHCITGWHE